MDLLARALAASFLAGSPDVESLTTRCSELLGKRWRWLRPLARRFHDAFVLRTRPTLSEAADFIRSDAGFRLACQTHNLQVRRPLVFEADSPRKPVRDWNIPRFDSVGLLAEWLDIPVHELQWLADQRTLEHKQKATRHRHYSYRLLSKGSGKVRLLESPKSRLKAIQRKILVDILTPVPPHDAAHGFRNGRSIKTFASPHVGKRVVLRLDLENFFPTISAARVHATFRAMGYSDSVVSVLTGLCTNTAPAAVWEEGIDPKCDRESYHARRLYMQPHLPQGAPTSPALANLCAYHVDSRLAGLARTAGAVYTRYADDLAFSGNEDFERCAERFRLHASATLIEEGFTVNQRKTRIMRQGVRQHLTGLVINKKLNVHRGDYDRLKAIVTNSLRHGPESQNRDGHADFRAHLRGQISFVEMVHPDRGRRLRDLFERIEW